MKKDDIHWPKNKKYTYRIVRVSSDHDEEDIEAFYKLINIALYENQQISNTNKYSLIILDLDAKLLSRQDEH